MPTRPALQVRGHKPGRMKHTTPCRGQKEHQMSVLTVGLKNQPGELARLCEAMAGRGINLILPATARENREPWCSSPTTRPAPRRCSRMQTSSTRCARR
jgi:hypothetical protein